MQIIFVIAGIFFIFACAVILLAWAWSIVDCRREERRQVSRSWYLEEARKGLGRMLISDSHWLSENIDAYCALDELGKVLLQGFPNMWDFRQNLWKRIEEEKAKR